MEKARSECNEKGESFFSRLKWASQRFCKSCFSRGIRATFVREAFSVSLCCNHIRWTRGVLRSIQTNLVSRFAKTSLTSLFLYYEDTTIILHVAWIADNVLLKRYVGQIVSKPFNGHVNPKCRRKERPTLKATSRLRVE